MNFEFSNNTFEQEKLNSGHDVGKTFDEKDQFKEGEIEKKVVDEKERNSFDPDKLVEANEGNEKSKLGKIAFDPDVLVEAANKNKVLRETDKEGEVEKKKGEPIQNKVDGLRREKEVGDELKEKYPESEGYKVESEKYLRDKDGKIVKDPETGEARRIDYVVIKDGKIVDSVEVTSTTADKTEQSAKEKRIRENGGNYILDDNGNLVEFPENVETRIERRD